MPRRKRKKNKIHPQEEDDDDIISDDLLSDDDEDSEEEEKPKKKKKRKKKSKKKKKKKRRVTDSDDDEDDDYTNEKKSDLDEELDDDLAKYNSEVDTTPPKEKKKKKKKKKQKKIVTPKPKAKAISKAEKKKLQIEKIKEERKKRQDQIREFHERKKKEKGLDDATKKKAGTVQKAYSFKLNTAIFFFIHNALISSFLIVFTFVCFFFHNWGIHGGDFWGFTFGLIGVISILPGIACVIIGCIITIASLRKSWAMILFYVYVILSVYGLGIFLFFFYSSLNSTMTFIDLLGTCGSGCWQVVPIDFAYITRIPANVLIVMVILDVIGVCVSITHVITGIVSLVMYILAFLYKAKMRKFVNNLIGTLGLRGLDEKDYVYTQVDQDEEANDEVKGVKVEDLTDKKISKEDSIDDIDDEDIE